MEQPWTRLGTVGGFGISVVSKGQHSSGNTASATVDRNLGNLELSSVQEPLELLAPGVSSLQLL